VTTTLSAADGSWAAEFPATRSWDVRAVSNDVRSSRTRIVVAPVVTAALRSARVRAGRSAVVTGGIRPRKAAVLIEASRRAGGRYVRAFTLRARAASGSFRAAVRLARPGLYRLRVRFAGDRRNGAAQAADLFVRAVLGPTGGRARTRADRLACARVASREEEKERRRQERRAQEQAAGGAAARRRQAPDRARRARGRCSCSAASRSRAGRRRREGRRRRRPRRRLPPKQTSDLETAAQKAAARSKEAVDEGTKHLPDKEATFDGYKTNPPTSGTHRPPPAAPDGFYEPGSSPAKEDWVHTLEHGRVIFQYAPGTPQQRIDQLEALMNEEFGGQPGGFKTAVMENNTSMPFAVAAVSWSRFAGCEEFTDATFDVLRAFREKYVGMAPEGDFPWPAG
jgi:hypothetical protein